MLSVSPRSGPPKSLFVLPAFIWTIFASLKAFAIPNLSASRACRSSRLALMVTRLFHATLHFLALRPGVKLPVPTVGAESGPASYRHASDASEPCDATRRAVRRCPLLPRPSLTSRTTSSSVGVSDAQPLGGRLRSPRPRCAYAIASWVDNAMPSVHAASKSFSSRPLRIVATKAS